MHRSRNIRETRYVFLLILILLSLLFIAVFLFPKYLYKDSPAEADIMVVEGWLPDYALEESIKEFNAGGYKSMIIVGTKMPDAFRIYSSGSLDFNLENSRITNTDGVAGGIAVSAYGTVAAGQYPHFCLYINDSLTGESYVNQKCMIYKFHINLPVNSIKTVRIRYDNDGYTYWRDRDLYVEYIKINNIKIPAYSNIAYYDMNGPDDYRQYSPGYDNNADYAAFILRYLGFTDSIETIPVLDTKLSNTYSCALAFRDWYLNSSYKGKPVNIVSLGPHTHRTWMVYRKVLGRDIDVGVILIDNAKYNKYNWWKSLKGISNTIDEAASYIYMALVLPFVNKDLKCR
jgi:hypothetical protein